MLSFLSSYKTDLFLSIRFIEDKYDQGIIGNFQENLKLFKTNSRLTAKPTLTGS